MEVLDGNAGPPKDLGLYRISILIKRRERISVLWGKQFTPQA